jgi:pyrimidine operon attenuation protein / uracil phosphoribosyltransferase
MPRGRTIVDTQKFNIIINRLAQQLIEMNGDFQNTCIIGIQEKGVAMAERLIAILEEKTSQKIEFGKLDITFYRDDFRMRDTPLKASQTQVDFQIEGKKVILIDDVVYSGRTIHAAIAALQDFGRPSKVELLCMVDRRFNRHLPVKSDYTGIEVDALDEAYVKVKWEHIDGKDQVQIFPAK